MDIDAGEDLSTQSMQAPTMKHRRSWLAGLLSFLLTGLGQLYNGQARHAALFYGVEVGAAIILFGLILPAKTFAVLVVAAALCLSVLIWKLASVVLAVRTARRQRQIALRHYNRWWVYLLLFLGVALAQAPLEHRVKSGMEAYSIPSTSNFPNLLLGDHFMALSMQAQEPQRGDIVTFKGPSGSTFVKRVIGLAGETVRLSDGIVYIDDVAVPREAAGSFDVTDAAGPHHVAQYRERLPNGKSYLALDGNSQPLLANMRSTAVPSGHFFVLGDYRDNSVDSRMDAIGMVPAAALKQKAAYIYWSPDVSRIGRKVE